MREYEVEIRKTLSRVIIVEAENIADAYDVAKQQYMDSDVVLDAEEDFQDVEFEVI